MRLLNHKQSCNVIALSIIAFSCYSNSDITTNNSSQPVYFYDISGVSHNDTLSMRAGAGADYQRLTQIPSDATFLVSEGERQRNGSSTWLKVNYQHYQGWVNQHYLKPSSTETFNELHCIGTEPYWSASIKRGRFTLRDLDDVATPFGLSSVIASSNHTNQWMLSARSAVKGEVSIALIKNNQCSDDMSERTYTHHILLKDAKNHVLSGCCQG